MFHGRDAHRLAPARSSRPLRPTRRPKAREHMLADALDHLARVEEVEHVGK